MTSEEFYYCSYCTKVYTVQEVEENNIETCPLCDEIWPNTIHPLSKIYKIAKSKGASEVWLYYDQ